MYTSFYNLDKKPFEKNPDPSFLWLGDKHKEALSTLLYGVLDNKGLLLLTGEAGSGKTILVKAFTQSLEKDVEWAVIADPRLERIDFYNAIARGFGIEKQFTSKVQFLIQFSHFLHKADDENKKVLLLVDDCHLLSQEMLEELRLLSNIEKGDARLINIFFVGQPGFNDMLLQPNNRAVNQRLTLKSVLDSLDVDETDDYILHRLKIAGTEEKLFSAKAVQVVHRFTQGIPGRINTICTHALISGSGQAVQTINNKVIAACVQEMDLPASLHQDDMDTFSGEKIDFNHFNEIFIPKPAKKMPSLSGFNLEGESQRGWLKYALGCLALLVVGLYFWFPAPHSSVKVEGLSVEIAKVEVAESVSQVSSSPVVTMLEENNSVSNGKKPVAVPRATMAPLEPKKIILGLRPNSLKLTNVGQKELNSFVEKLKNYPWATVYVKGYVSAKSNSPENIKLSEARALSVQNLMLVQGIDAEQIEVVGMGNLDPIASNNTSEGRRKNRRVEVIVVDDGI